MERYCGILCKKEEFCEENRINYWNLDIEKIIEDICSDDKKNESQLGGNDGKHLEPEIAFAYYNGLIGNRDYGSFLLDSEQKKMFPDEEKRNLEQCKAYYSEFIKYANQAIYSNECRLDIFNEIYIILQNALGEEEKLYLDEWNDACVKPLDEAKGKVSNTINNYKKNQKESKEKYLIFEMEKLRSTSKNAKIPVLGSGVRRLWLLSRQFRNLFREIDPPYTKYELKKIDGSIEEGKKNGIKYGAGDFIIFEKLLGLNTRIYLGRCIVPLIGEDEYDDIIEPLIEALMQCKGCFSRCFLIGVIGYELSRFRQHDIGVRKKEIKEIIFLLLKEIVTDFNIRYDRVIKTAIDELKKNLTCRDSFELIKRQRKRLIDKGMGTIWSAVAQQERNEQEVQKLVEYFAKSKDREEINRQFQRWQNTCGVYSIVSEISFMLDPSYTTSWIFKEKEDDIMSKIQSQIVKAGYSMYNSDKSK